MRQASGRATMVLLSHQS